MRRFMIVWCGLWALAGSTAGCSSVGQSAAQAPPTISNVLIVHGSANYWPGCKDFASNLAVRGIPATVVHGWEVNRVADRLVEARQSGAHTGPLVLIGYSRGGNDAVRLTRRLQDNGITVTKLVLMETAAQTSIPANVESCLNIYQSSEVTDTVPVLRGHPVTVESHETQLTNYNLRFHDEVLARSDLNHFTVSRNFTVLTMISDQISAAFEQGAPADTAATETQLVSGTR